LRYLAFVGAICLAGCGQYADFQLPHPQGSAEPVEWSWTAAPAPVLKRGAETAWDSHDVLNPSVVPRNGLYFNFYSGFDGETWHTGLATSPDGENWQKSGKVLSPEASSWEGAYIAANGSALWHEGQFWYWYQAGPKDHPRIALARSADGRSWRKEPQPVLDFGPRGSWDERALGDPFVIRAEDYFYLYYLGQDRARRQRLGLARSRDGVRWERLRANPILDLGAFDAFDEVGLGEPAVWTSHGSYWMLYTGRDRQEVRRMGLAESLDGVKWRRHALVIEGSQSWNNKTICDPDIELRGDRVRVWFGGGNAPSPDENLSGEIGVGYLSPASQ
jgi:predicted GH43/DUF377 family glycosyl hydrolase